MEANNILLPFITPETKKTTDVFSNNTYSFFQLDKIDLDLIYSLYPKRERFSESVKLVKKISNQKESNDIGHLKYRFLIEACNKQDAFVTLLYIVHNLNQADMCNCNRVFKGNPIDLNDLGENNFPRIYNVNNGNAAIDNKDEDDDDIKLPKWRQNENEGVFFISDSVMPDGIGFSSHSLPPASKLAELNNQVIFLIRISSDIKDKNNRGFIGTWGLNSDTENTSEYVLQGFKRITIKSSNNKDLVDIFGKYICSKGYNIRIEKKHLEQLMIKFGKSLNYPIRELDIKNFADAVIDNHIIYRSEKTNLTITDKDFEFLKKQKTRKPGTKRDTTSNPWLELDKMIGMDEIKIEIRNLVNRLKLDKKRQKLKLPSSGINMNAVFLGSPGTNKTSTARIIAKILAYEKLIPSENFKECGKEDIVGQYVGWTAVQIKELFKSLSEDSSSGGVLFIDEAYSITEDQTCFDKEAVNTLVQCMENYRNSVMVIFGGYKQKMLEFMSKNEGLRSRVSFVFEFKNYANDALLQIFKYQASLYGFEIQTGCEESIINYFKALKNFRGESFGNGREARTLFELASLELSNRIGMKKKPNKLEVSLITIKDIENAISKALSRENVISGRIQNNKKPIGFFLE